ncbi:hypothetical protein [Cellulomonas sp. P5_C5]
MTAARRWLRGVSSGLLIALTIVVPALPAAAANELELSSDGVTWSSTLTGVLFGAPEHVVPGDVVTSALWVRNGSADPAQVRLDVADDLGITPGTLAGDLSLAIDGDPVAGGARWAGPVLAPGAAVRIPLVVSFAAASPSGTQMSAAAVLDSVLLVQSVVSPTPTPGATATGTTPRGGLAHTGQDVAATLLVSLAAVGFGVLLLASRRRARRHEG